MSPEEIAATLVDSREHFGDSWHHHGCRQHERTESCDGCIHVDRIVTAIRSAVVAEREACLAIVTATIEYLNPKNEFDAHAIAMIEKYVAAQIRARGEK